MIEIKNEDETPVEDGADTGAVGEPDTNEGTDEDDESEEEEKEEA